MYWGQTAVALTVALIAGYGALQSGWTLAMAVLAGILIYILTRWTITWIYRVQYWYPRGEKVRSQSCPSCGGYIYRQGGDWMLQCKRCGWTEGWPVSRWFLHSLPAQQLRRTIVGPHLVLAVVVVALLASGGFAGITLPSFDQDPTILTEEQDGYDEDNVRETFLSYLNEERADRGLQTLSLREELTEMGEAHAANMAEHDYIGHEWPDGTTIQDRYSERGLLPECRLDIEGTNQYYAGAENAAGAWFDRRFESSGGSYYVTDEEELGQVLFSIWMNSQLHREAMLVHSASEMGLGINITEDGKVYAALELC